MEDFNSKYSGEQVEALLDQVASGNAGGGGGGITVETDPIFSASPAASITDADKVAWNNKVDYANKSLSIVGADGFMTSEGEGFVLPNTPAAQGEHGLVLATLDDIPDELTESDIAAMGFTKNEGTITEVKMNGVSKGKTGVVDLGNVPTPESVDNLQGLVEDLGSEVGKLTQNKVDKVEGKQLSTEDFTTILKTKLEGLSNYDDTELSESIDTLRQDFDKLVSGDTTTAIKTFNEIIAFLDGIQDSQDLSSIIASIEQQIAGKQDAINDLETIRDGAAKGATAVQPETLSDYALEGYVDSEIKALGDSLAEVATSGSYSDLSDNPTFKTINGESIVGDGNIEISGGSGEVGPQGPQGDKGDKGDKGDTGATGVGVQSVKQTTISNTDGGSNVVTVTLTNGTTSTFTVKNGSKGSSGTNGTNGKDGADGATFTPSVDSAGNLSWTNNKGLTNPPTVNIKGPKGDAGEGGGGGGVPVIAATVNMGELSFSEDTIPLESDKIYYANESTEMVYIVNVTPPTGDVGKYSVHFTTSSIVFGFECPQNWLWVNGTIPTIESSTTYELSVVATKFGNDYIYKAVLTPFKAL